MSKNAKDRRLAILKERQQRLLTRMHKDKELIGTHYMQLPDDHPLKEVWWKVLRAHDRWADNNVYQTRYPRPPGLRQPSNTFMTVEL